MPLDVLRDARTAALGADGDAVIGQSERVKTERTQAKLGGSGPVVECGDPPTHE
jgi:hypothetical protein